MGSTILLLLCRFTKSLLEINKSDCPKLNSKCILFLKESRFMALTLTEEFMTNEVEISRTRNIKIDFCLRYILILFYEIKKGNSQGNK